MGHWIYLMSKISKKSMNFFETCSRADPDQMESLAIHMVGINRLYFNEVEHVLDRKSLPTFPEHALAGARGSRGSQISLRLRNNKLPMSCADANNRGLFVRALA